MKHFRTILFFALLISFQLFNLPNNVLAQDRSIHKKPESTSIRKYHSNDRSGESSISDASKIGYDRITHRNDFYTERYNRNSKNSENNFNNNRKDKFEKQIHNNRKGTNYSNNEVRTGNYFHIDKSGRTLWDGKHWDISSFPLKIYIKESPSRYFKSVYKDYVNYALNVWRSADDRINYTFVKSRRAADISVIFIEDLGEKYNEDYLGLTEYDIDRGKRIDYSKIQIGLIKFEDEVVSDGEIKATIIHELGHAFGLGHSKTEFDIMYPYIHSDHSPQMNYDELSSGDREAIEDVIDLGRDDQYVLR
jgi:hypothetical protein